MIKYFLIATLSSSFGYLMASLFKSSSYNQGFDDGYEAGHRIGRSKTIE